MYEIILKKPIKLLIASPICELDVLRIETETLGSPTDERLRFEHFIQVNPLRVFATQHSDWIDSESSAIQLFNLCISPTNISNVIYR